MKKQSITFLAVLCGVIVVLGAAATFYQDKFIGDGSGLTSLPAASSVSTGVSNQWRLDATNASTVVTSGYPWGVLYQPATANGTNWSTVSTNQYVQTNQAGAVQITNAANTFGGVGTSLTALNASSLSSGTVASGRLPDLSTTYEPHVTTLTNQYYPSNMTAGGTIPTAALATLANAYPAALTNADTRNIQMTSLGVGVAAASASGTLNVNSAQTNNSKMVQTVQALSIGGTGSTNVTVDFSTGNHFSLTCTTNVYFAQPSNLSAMQEITIDVRQDGTGTRTFNFNTAYWLFPGGQILTMTTNANSKCLLSCIADQYGTNVWVVQTLNFQ